MQCCTFKLVALLKEAGPKRYTINDINMSLLYPEASDFYTQRWCMPRPRKQKDQMVDFIRLCKIMRKFFDDSGNYNPHKKLFKAQCYPAKQFVPGTRMRLQMSTLYCNYGNSIHSHKELLRRYMPQKNKEAVTDKPVLFGNISTEEYEKKIIWRHYKFMLSPETKMDRNSLEEYAKKFMEKFELYQKLTGRQPSTQIRSIPMCTYS